MSVNLNVLDPIDTLSPALRQLRDLSTNDYALRCYKFIVKSNEGAREGFYFGHKEGELGYLEIENKDYSREPIIPLALIGEFIVDHNQEIINVRMKSHRSLKKLWQ